MRFNVILLIFVLTLSSIHPQIVFHSDPEYKISEHTLDFLGKSSLRQKILLNGNWNVYKSKNSNSVVKVKVPSYFEGDGELIFEKQFFLSKEQLEQYVPYLRVMGLSYFADISLNGSVIYRHSSGSLPFSVFLPKDLLKKDSKNTISIKLISNLDFRYTIPPKGQFLFPRQFGGIFRDIYIELLPNISVDHYDYKISLNSGNSRAIVDLRAIVSNRNYKPDSVFSSTGDDLTVSFTIAPTSNPGQIVSANISGQVGRGREKEFVQKLEINSPILWAPESPTEYLLKISLYNGDQLVDVVERTICIYSFRVTKEKTILNDKEYFVRGVTYVPSYPEYGLMADYARMREDILLIKETGFNAVRITKTIPHQYLLALCQEIGLLAFIEVPLQSFGSFSFDDETFIPRTKHFIAQYAEAYSKYQAVAGMGVLTGTYLTGKNTVTFLSETAEIVRKQGIKTAFVTFSNSDFPEIEGMDFYGIDYLNTNAPEIFDTYTLKAGEIGAGRFWITEAAALTVYGTSNGYVNPLTREAQAKFYSDMLSYADQVRIPAVFLGPMFDYRTAYKNIIGGYSDDELIPIGIIGEDRRHDRISYKVIFAALHNQEKVTVPLGIKKDNAPMVFVVFGLVLAIFLGLLVNSGKKFREDALRALIRPYNFFADVRDLRIFSPLQTIIVTFLISAIGGLIGASILHYLKDSITFERILLAIGSEWVMSFVSYLAWNPLESIFIIAGAFILMNLLVTVVVKLFSFSVMNKVFFSSVFYTVSWTAIPVLLLVPLGIILFRVLVIDAVNSYIYLFLLIFGIWLAYRLFKGIHVIFDIHPVRVYFIGFLTLTVIPLAVVFYLQVVNRTLDNILPVLFQLNSGL